MDLPVKIIDGGVLEGGGQILRNVSALSCLFGAPVKISNIRAGRDKPGLRPQHLCGLQLVAQLCKGELKDAVVGSREITLTPGTDVKVSSTLCFDTHTAGSISLLLQTSIPCLAFAGSKAIIELMGGTDVEHAPPIDFMANVFQFYGRKFGLNTNLELVRRGFYPRGGGKVVLSSEPVHQLNSVVLMDQGKIIKVRGRSWIAGNLPDKIADVARKSALRRLKNSKLSGVDMDIDVERESPKVAPIGAANAIELYAETTTGCLIASSRLGRKGYDAEQMGLDAAEQLIANIEQGECVDEYIQDQVVILMALAKGHSRIRTGPQTLHTKTAIFMAELMTDSKVKFTHEPAEDGLGGFILEATGIGFENKHSL